VISLLRTLIGISGAALLAIPLYHFSIFGLGLPLLGFFANLLVMGWSIGLLVAGMVLRYGLGAESLAWVSIFAIAPLSGIYYPVSTLPEWLQPVSWLLPSSHVFEGMRQLMFGQVMRTDLMWQAIGLNLVYLAAGTGFFCWRFTALAATACCCGWANRRQSFFSSSCIRHIYSSTGVRFVGVPACSTGCSAILYSGRSA
jgi:ABC-2 type transport system permease protein